MKALVFLAALAAIIGGGIYFGIIPVNSTASVTSFVSAENPSEDNPATISDDDDIPESVEAAEDASIEAEMKRDVESNVDESVEEAKNEDKVAKIEAKKKAEEEKARKKAEKAREAAANYDTGVRWTGGAIIHQLVKKCDYIDDEYIEKSTGKEARAKIMKCLRGDIGELNFHLVKKNESTGPTKGSAFGEEYRGKLRGPRTFPPPGDYVFDKPDTFDEGIKKLTRASKLDSREARVQLAALYFMGAADSKKFTERQMYDWLREAAQKGQDEDALFMCAVCNYYGIGTSKNRPSALKILKRWRKSNERIGDDEGWIAERLSK